MPAIFHNTLGAALFVIVTFVEAVIGSLIVLFPILPFMVLHPILFRKMVDHLMMLALGLPLALLEFMFDVRVVVSGDVPVPREKTLVIMNHRTMVDWLFFFQVLMHYSSVKTEKIFLKKGPSMVPGFGWAMQMGNYIFLARKWEKDKPWLERCFKYYKDLKYTGLFLLFPEGTDFCEASHKRSDSFADKNGLPHYEYVLHPRTTGFAFILDSLRKTNMIDSVIDVTVGYPDCIPLKLEPIKGHFPQRVEFHMQRYQLSELPTETTEIEKWCVDRWKEKEVNLREFYTEKRSLVDIIGESAESKTTSNGTVAYHQHGDLEPNGNSIKCGDARGSPSPAVDHSIVPREAKTNVAHTHFKNLVGVYFFWFVLTVFSVCGLYFSVIIRYHCLLAFAVFFAAYYVGGTDNCQQLAYNWLKRSRFSPQMTV